MHLCAVVQRTDATFDVARVYLDGRREGGTVTDIEHAFTGDLPGDIVVSAQVDAVDAWARQHGVQVTTYVTQGGATELVEGYVKRLGLVSLL